MGQYNDFDLDLKQVKSDSVVTSGLTVYCTGGTVITKACATILCSNGCTVGPCATPTQGGFFLVTV